MKVVLFCGGFGMRLREYSEQTPKPMVEIGYRPILWHIMKWYAHFGHKEFILCLGWKADVFKRYFLNYNECASNDFVMSRGGRDIDLLSSDIDDWSITFCDTGTRANVGERLLAVEKHLDGEETFLANYADGLSDVYLPSLIDFHRQQQSVATFMAVKPSQTFHVVSVEDSGEVHSINTVQQTDTWINAGFFVLQQEIFKYVRDGEDLVLEPFERLIREKRLTAMKHHGFYGCMDTFKEKQTLDDMYARGDRPWALWEKGPHTLETPRQSDVFQLADPNWSRGVHANGNGNGGIVRPIVNQPL